MLQLEVDKLEGSLLTTSRVIMQEKTFWYLFNFHWYKGFWMYKNISECPGSLSANYISGE
jgi:hypothetical protein